MGGTQSSLDSHLWGAVVWKWAGGAIALLWRLQTVFSKDFASPEIEAGTHSRLQP